MTDTFKPHKHSTTAHTLIYSFPPNTLNHFTCTHTNTLAFDKHWNHVDTFRATELSPPPSSAFAATMTTNNSHGATVQLMEQNTNADQMKLKLGSSALFAHLLKSLIFFILPSRTMCNYTTSNAINNNKHAPSTQTQSIPHNNNEIKMNCQTQAQAQTQAPSTHTRTARTSLLSIDSFYTTTTASFASFAFVSASSSSSLSSPNAFIIPSSASATSAGNLLSFNVNAHHLDDSRVYRRLLVQLEETERRFDDFWNTHLTRLKQCLDLRRFEQDFRELQVSRSSPFSAHAFIWWHFFFLFCHAMQTNFDGHLNTVSEMTEIGETVQRVDTLLWETKAFQKLCDIDIERAEEVVATGESLDAWIWSTQNDF